jgi:hypothetical protein
MTKGKNKYGKEGKTGDRSLFYEAFTVTQTIQLRMMG